MKHLNLKRGKGEVSPMNYTENKKKLNNKGFSLVELIIVIAIMAVLIGVLAPQYLKYVEKSRESSDADSIQSVITALQVYASDVDNTTSLTAGTIKFNKNASPTVTGTNAANCLKDSSITLANLKLTSSAYSDKTLTITVTDNVPTFTVNDADLAAALGISVTPSVTP